MLPSAKAVSPATESSSVASRPEMALAETANPTVRFNSLPLTVTPMMVGAAALAVIVLGGGVWMLVRAFEAPGRTTLSTEAAAAAAPSQPVDASAAVSPPAQPTDTSGAPAPVAPPATSPLPVTSTASKVTVPTSRPGTSTTASSTTAGRTAPVIVADASASNASTTKPPVTEAISTDGVARERLEIARAKMKSNLLEPALADLAQIRRDFATNAAAADASFLSSEIFEKLNRIEDAMAMHVEFNKRFPSDSRLAASKLRLAELTLKSRLANREASAREILNDIATSHPRTEQAFAALRLKLTLEQGRAREKDPVLGIDVPRSLPTLRTLTEQFPTSPLTMAEWSRLANMYDDLEQYQLAATTYESLGTLFPSNPYDAWFRAGEIYERRLKNVDKAREAYAKVPATSARYRDAQRKLK
jgi:tetratricopeptide (TPR) repeat protein